MPEAVALPEIGSVAVCGSGAETGSVARVEARQAGCCYCSQAGHVSCLEWRVEKRERVVSEAWLLSRGRLPALLARLRPG